MTHLKTNPAVVTALLALYAFRSPAEVQAAADELAHNLRQSMTHTTAYGIPLDQHLPAEVSRATSAPYVHPNNLAAALHSLAGVGAQLDSSLLVYSPEAGGWQPLAQCTTDLVPVTVAPPPAPPVQAIPPAPPAPAPVPPPPPPPPAPTPEAIIAPSTVPATPLPATHAAAAPAPVPQAPTPPAEQFPQGVNTVADLAAYREATGHPAPAGSLLDLVAATQPGLDPYAAAAPAMLGQAAAEQPRAPAFDPALGAGYGTTAQGVPGPAVVTHAQAQAESHLAPVEGLPDASVLAQRTGANGRPAKSPFEREIEARKSVAAAPFWWEHLLHSAQHVFTQNPATALDPSSTGSGPVQAYAVLTRLLERVLRNADPDLTVAQLRAFLREVDTGIASLPSAAAIYQIADHLFTPKPTK